MNKKIRNFMISILAVIFITISTVSPKVSVAAGADEVEGLINDF